MRIKMKKKKEMEIQKITTIVTMIGAGIDSYL